MNAVQITTIDRQLDGELIKTCDGRDLHAELGVAKDYTSWAKAQIKRGRLVENRDYVKLTQKGELSTTGQTRSDYHFTVEAGKHIGMMSGTARGFEVREYFIACERTARGLPVQQLPYSVGQHDTLTREQQDELRGIMTAGAQRLPINKQGSFLTTGWSKLKAHFKVSYREIPRNEFSEAVSIATRHVAEFAVPALAPPADTSLHQALDTMNIMANSLADLTAAVVNLTHDRAIQPRASPPRRATKDEAETLGPVSASVTQEPSRNPNHVEV